MLKQFPLPITVYVVVAVGLAATVNPLAALNPTAGDQLYVFAPLPVSVVEAPSQIVLLHGVPATRLVYLVK